MCDNPPDHFKEKKKTMALDGNWNLTMNSPMGARPVTANFKTDGGTISGEFTGPQGNAPVTGTADGNNVAFSATIAGPMGQMELKFSGAVDGDTVSGNVQFGAFGSGTFSGAKA
jgi:autotransporter translocation and assembly factor TamB